MKYTVTCNSKPLDQEFKSAQQAVEFLYKFLHNHLIAYVRDSQTPCDVVTEIVAEVNHGDKIIDKPLSTHEAFNLLLNNGELFLKGQTVSYENSKVIVTASAKNQALMDYFEQQEAKNKAHYDLLRLEDDRKVSATHSAVKKLTSLKIVGKSKEMSTREILLEAEAKIFVCRVRQFLARTTLTLDQIDAHCKFAKGTMNELLFGNKPIIPTEKMIEAIAEVLKVRPAHLHYNIASNYESWYRCITPPAPLRKQSNLRRDLIRLDSGDD